MKYGIIFNPELGDNGEYSLVNLETNEVIVSAGDDYINAWGKEDKKALYELTWKMKELTCKEYIEKCIKDKTVFKYKYNDYRFVVGSIACDGQWYSNCLDYRDGSIAVCTQYYDITKLPSVFGIKVESNIK